MIGGSAAIFAAYSTTRRLLPGVVALGLAAATPGCGQSRSRYAHLVERPLASSEGLGCTGYVVWNREHVRDVFLVINGSGTLSNAFVAPAFERALRDGPAAYATYDKPGIHAPFGDPADVTRDYALLERYGLGQGVACAIDALHGLRAQFGAAARVHIRGHSEGSLVALYTYDQLLEREPEVAASIATLILSGVPLEPIPEVLEHQISTMPDGAKLRDALARCSPNVVRKLGVSCGYFADAARRPSGRAMFERLVGRTHARLHVFGGLRDWNTPVGPVRALDAWNASMGSAALPLELHYYDGGHAGNDEARAELARIVAAIVASD